VGELANPHRGTGGGEHYTNLAKALADAHWKLLQMALWLSTLPTGISSLSFYFNYKSS